MNDLDNAIRDYFGQPEVIAELFNRFVLDENLNPSKMIPVEKVAVFHRLRDYGSKLTLEKFQHMYRNLFLLKAEKFYFVLLVEAEISNALPIKLCLFENGLYATDIEAWDCLSNGGLLPCLTVVLYLSSKNYSQHEIVSEYPSEYSFYMIKPANISDDTIAELSEDLGGVLQFVKISNNAEKKQEFLSSEAFARMGDSAKSLVQCFSDYLGLK